jgi:hypothetical protein
MLHNFINLLLSIDGMTLTPKTQFKMYRIITIFEFFCICPLPEFLGWGWFHDSLEVLTWVMYLSNLKPTETSEPIICEKTFLNLTPLWRIFQTFVQHGKPNVIAALLQNCLYKVLPRTIIHPTHITHLITNRETRGPL